jgi:hypothetical protein
MFGNRVFANDQITIWLSGWNLIPKDCVLVRGGNLARNRHTEYLEDTQKTGDVLP